MSAALPVIHAAETVDLSSLKPHPRNYRSHPADQIAHLQQSILEHGVFRNVVIARDSTILAGHGVVEAMRGLGIRSLPVVRLDLAPDDPRALKVLTGDNELARLAEIDDRALTELLREVKETDLTGLLGTGYDEAMLASLLYVTRPASEVKDKATAAEWVGMPEFAPDYTPDELKVTVSLRSQEDRTAFFALLGVPYTDKTRSVWWPHRERDDLIHTQFQRNGHA